MPRRWWMRALGACLAQVVYRQTVVVNHTDSRFLPTDARDRCDLYLVTVQEAGVEGTGKGMEMVVPPSYTMTTHMLPRPAIKGAAPLLPSARPAAVLQTTNPVVPPAQGTVLSVARLERALLTQAGKDVVALLSGSAGGEEVVGAGRVGRLQGAARRADGGAAGLWVVGSYAYRGIPLLEGCVAGAREVVEGAGGLLECEGVRVAGAPW